MRKLNFFGTQNHEVKNLIKVFKMPKNIVFDSEEEEAINNEFESHTEDFKGLPTNVRELTESGFAATSLINLSQRKLEKKDFEGAFSACIKSLALFDLYESSWLLLAEILAEYGSLEAAKQGVDYAQKIHEKNWNTSSQPELLGMTGEEWWQAKKEHVLDIIETKRH